MANFHYEWLCETDNLCWGRMKIGVFKTRQEACEAGERANKGCYRVRRIRKS